MTNILYEDKNDNTQVIPLSVEHDLPTSHTTIAMAAFTPEDARLAVLSTNEMEEKGNILLKAKEMDTLCLAWMAYRSEQKTEKERIAQEFDALLEKIQEHGFEVEEGDDFTIISEFYHIRLTSAHDVESLQNGLDSALLEVREQEAEKEAKRLSKLHKIHVEQTSVHWQFEVGFPYGKQETVNGRLNLLDAVKRAIAEQQEGAEGQG